MMFVEGELSLFCFLQMSMNAQVAVTTAIIMPTAMTVQEVTGVNAALDIQEMAISAQVGERLCNMCHCCLLAIPLKVVFL